MVNEKIVLTTDRRGRRRGILAGLVATALIASLLGGVAHATVGGDSSELEFDRASLRVFEPEGGMVAYSFAPRSGVPYIGDAGGAISSDVPLVEEEEEPGADIAGGVDIAPAAVACTVITPPAPAWDSGSTNRPRAGFNELGAGALRPGNVYYVFVEACGWLDIRFAVRTLPVYAAIVVAVAPDGTVHEERAYLEDLVVGDFLESTGLRSETAGVWRISLRGENASGGSASVGGVDRFDIVPRSSNGTPHAGRVWVEVFLQDHGLIPSDMRFLNPHAAPGTTSAGAHRWNQSLFFLSEQGFRYQQEVWSFNGINSMTVASNLGVNRDCVPQRRTVWARSSSVVDHWGYHILAGHCPAGSQYRIFFENTDLTMPEEALFYDGSTRWVNPTFAEPTLSIRFEMTGPITPGRPHGGDIVIETNHAGEAHVQIDTNGNGVFTDATDLAFSFQVAPGVNRFPWDGQNGLGQPVPFTQTINLRSQLDVGHFHVISLDVEYREGGVRMTALNGPLAADPVLRHTMHWGIPDDPHLCSTNYPDRRPCDAGMVVPTLPHSPMYTPPGGINSYGGVHRWGWDTAPGVGVGTWGDARVIDEWMVLSNIAQATTSFTGGYPQPGISVVKTSPAGDPAEIVAAPGAPVQAEVSFTITNTGEEVLGSITWSDNTVVGPDVTWQSCTGGVTLSGMSGTLTGVSIPVDGSITCTGTLTMGTADAHENALTVTGTGQSSGTTVSATDDWELSVVRSGIQVVKTSLAGDPAVVAVAPGGTPNPFEVTFTVTNAGTEPKADLTWNDVTVEGPSVNWTGCDEHTGSVNQVFNGLILLPGESVVCRGTLTMGAAIEHENVLTVTGVGVETGGSVSATDDWQLTVVSSGLQVTKTSPIGDPARVVVAPGQAVDPVEVTFTITNIGLEAKSSLTWNDVTVEGPAVDWVSCDGHVGSVDAVISSLTLAPGAAVTCQGTLVMGNALEHRNVLTVTGEGAQTSTTSSAEDEWELLVVRSGLKVVKTS
ncbi:MAG: hypothetical protein FWD83_09955, partial [Promicromonosporaceae bacterium]|nr:hypothetical protein [Promicromonosporaceae bacterium]